MVLEMLVVTNALGSVSTVGLPRDSVASSASSACVVPAESVVVRPESAREERPPGGFDSFVSTFPGTGSAVSSAPFSRVDVDQSVNS
jgi:hypothetical protein